MSVPLRGDIEILYLFGDFSELQGCVEITITSELLKILLFGILHVY